MEDSMAADGFEDDYAVGSGDWEASTAAELTEREKAIATGRNPDDAGADAKDGEEAEAEDKDVADTDVAASEEEGKDAPGSGWADDSTKELAESYGIDEETLASFESEADFKRFANIFEKALQKEPEPEEKPAPKKSRKAKVAPSAEKQDDEPEPEDALNLKEFEDGNYDESTLRVVKSVAKLQGVVNDLLARNEQLEQRIAAGDTEREQTVLYRELDVLGGRFGKSDSLTRDQKKARATLVDAAEVVKQSLAKRGEKASASVILRRAELLAFGDDIIADEKARQKEALSQSVKKQSAKRRQVGRNTKQPVRRERLGDAENPVKAIANSPELVEFWKSVQDD